MWTEVILLFVSGENDAKDQVNINAEALTDGILSYAKFKTTGQNQSETVPQTGHHFCAIVKKGCLEGGTSVPVNTSQSVCSCRAKISFDL